MSEDLEALASQVLIEQSKHDDGSMPRTRDIERARCATVEVKIAHHTQLSRAAEKADDAELDILRRRAHHLANEVRGRGARRGRATLLADGAHEVPHRGLQVPVLHGATVPHECRESHPPIRRASGRVLELACEEAVNPPQIRLHQFLRALVAPLLHLPPQGQPPLGARSARPAEGGNDRGEAVQVRARLPRRNRRPGGVLEDPQRAAHCVGAEEMVGSAERLHDRARAVRPGTTPQLLAVLELQLLALLQGLRIHPAEPCRERSHRLPSDVMARLEQLEGLLQVTLLAAALDVALQEALR
mmetsp:Transcript_96518/g.278584  ORF Transcript_96518/g.278584 Transcript_96518/m.278584 type:complete len:301 (+) Transcript_96518:749-1651(+)